MNYWSSYVTNLQEVTPPLYDLIASVAKNGAQVARQMYNCSGWVSHLDNCPPASPSPFHILCFGTVLTPYRCAIIIRKDSALSHCLLLTLTIFRSDLYGDSAPQVSQCFVLLTTSIPSLSLLLLG